MQYISVKCEYFSAKFMPNPALLPKLFLIEAMSIHSGGVEEHCDPPAPDQHWEVMGSDMPPDGS
ncbi:MAG: hypothetical protein JO183_02790 [Ktedonobacteraceae bacterium]|nr:hypothetical protein [Ktedonobacteraceae bacterium]